MSRNLLSSLVMLALLGCATDSGPALPGQLEAGAAAGAPGGFVTVSFPEEDPGPPFYARFSTLLDQTFNDGELAAIPFVRDPSCVPLDFDLLSAFHLPDANGPGAFGCPLVVSGRFLIEPDAEPGTFPFHVSTHGRAHIWILPWPALQAEVADGRLTMGELLALQPLRGIADRFDEVLRPRIEDHHVVITSQGSLEDGRRFQFNVNHRGDVTQSIMIRIR
jgi:hypothetical protein